MPDYESIWADGVVPKVDLEDHLKPQDILHLCIQFFMDVVIKDKGYEIVGLNDDPKRYPNVLIKKDERLYAVVICPCLGGKIIPLKDNFRFKYVKQVKEREAIPIASFIYFSSYDKKRAEAGILLKGDLFNLKLIGNKELNLVPTVSYAVQNLNFVF